MHMLNQSNNKPDLDLNFGPVTNLFVNTFNKRVRTEENVSDIDESANLQDFYHDAMEHNQNPTVQCMNEIEDKVNNACSSLETMNNLTWSINRLIFSIQCLSVIIRHKSTTT
ncbi:hypothetical protein RCL_jg25493.t1 [Rhizophagus clarus]|uniref:Uncharacterized protein n=1 Tax=Rhizophagus clarus TaxID=94130 RepID=A0A8H3LFX8_9GLOM|nr:hypothetical protein RCL_jg25493.t1 [Rhizophagus clarus]